jgi:uncharacterized metal-binding protein YceD (DUF177 family)
MAIRVSLGLAKDGLNEFDIIAAPGNIGIAEGVLKGNLELFISVLKISHQLDFSVKITGKLILECDRCLEKFEKDFSNSFELVYVVNDDGRKIDNDEYVRAYSPHMRYIDITKDVKDFVELSVPMRKVPDEKPGGACSWCGKTADYWKSFMTEEIPDDEIPDDETTEE